MSDSRRRVVVGWIIALTFGTWFYLSGNIEMATLAVSLAGALVGFLYFNFSKGRNFMQSGMHLQ